MVAVAAVLHWLNKARGRRVTPKAATANELGQQFAMSMDKKSIAAQFTAIMSCLTRIEAAKVDLLPNKGASLS